VRQVILDTETTGLDPAGGHRIIEIGCLELVNRRQTGRNFHKYVNPGRGSDQGALDVHGITEEFLADKPKFAEVVDDLLEFVKGAEIVIHNAPFDVAFLDAEMARLDRGAFGAHCERITDSLKIAREIHPGKRNSLNALCERYGVSNAHRTLHGALLDAQLLAEVFLAMTRGQDSLVIELAAQPGSAAGDGGAIDASALIVLAADDEERAAHDAYLDGLDKEAKGGSVWRAASGTQEAL
jgi:DNA polymerase-3 subunit epsilon